MVSSSARDRRVRHALELFHDLGDGGRGDVRANARSDPERPGVLAEDELRERAVRVAVRLAQVEVDAAREEPAQDQVHHVERGVVGHRSRRADLGHPQLRLLRARAIDQHQPHGRRRERVARAGGGRALRPRAERLLGERLHVRLADRPGDDQRRVVRHEVLLPEIRQVIAPGGLNRRLGTELDVAVRMVVAVEHAHGDRLRDGVRILPALNQLAQPARPLAIDLLVRESSDGARRRPADRAPRRSSSGATAPSRTTRPWRTRSTATRQDARRRRRW